MADGNPGEKVIDIELGATRGAPTTLRAAGTQVKVRHVFLSGQKPASASTITLRKTAGTTGPILWQLVPTGITDAANVQVATDGFDSTDGLFLDAIATVWTGARLLIYTE